jgi:hypothetical protein
LAQSLLLPVQLPVQLPRLPRPVPQLVELPEEPVAVRQAAHQVAAMAAVSQKNLVTMKVKAKASLNH